MADLLFSDSLISQEVQSSLPEGYHMRPLSSKDYERGFLQALSQLTIVGDTTKDQFLDRFNYLKKHSHEYFTLVIVETSKDRVVAAGTVFVERKFIRENGLVGHIEDIVVDKVARGHNFGRWIIEALKHVGAKTGCYKVILDCSEKNVPFYQKCGFSRKEVEMAWYVPDNLKVTVPKAKL